jgi:aryl-alcohol dehydrogenase-like predicted oxidoreductase
MQHRYLGDSGLKVSALAYGNWITHGGQIGDDAALACVRRALDLGITTFDTADVYSEGRAEEVLGRALEGERREGLTLCTKVYWRTGDGPNDSGLSRKHVLESCDASLRRLRTDHIDLYQCHRFDTETPLEETMVALADLVRQGKVGYLGVSEWTAEQIRQGHALAMELRVPFISNQPQYSMIWRVIEPEVVPTCRELGVSQIVWSPLLQGVLTGKYRPGEPPPAGTRGAATDGSADTLSFILRDELLTRVQELARLAGELGCTPAQLALAWVLANDNVASAIVGATRPEQLDDNAGALDDSLSADVSARVDEILGSEVVDDASLTEAFAPTERP